MIKNIIIIRILYLFFLFLFLGESSLGQQGFDVKTDSLIQAGIELSIQHDYAKAESNFQQLIDNYPDHPVGYFFMAATIQAKMMDYESDRWSQDFYRFIRLAIDCAEKKQAENNDSDLLSMFYHGSALCYLAFYEGRDGDILKAVNHGLSGISLLKKIKKIDPEFHDASFGIGSYKYWRSQKTKFLSWLPLISDERAEGIEMVRQAVDNGKYIPYAAMNELTWILLEAGEAEEAYSWAMKGLEKFPRSRFFLWGAAKSALARENYSSAASLFQKLLDFIIQAPFDNYYNEYICRVKLAQCFQKLGRFAEASAQIIYIDSLPLSPEIDKKLKKQHKELSQLKETLSVIAKIECPVDSSATEHDFANKQRSQ